MRTEVIEFWSNDALIVSFDMTRPDVRNPYTIKAITGLDADEIVSTYYASGSVSGKKFNELTLPPREITMRIDMKPNYRLSQHPSDLRAKLQRAIASSRTGEVELRFLNDGMCWGSIKGHISKFEAPLTTKDTEIQFTMRCSDPIIRSQGPTSQNLAILDDDPVIVDPVSTSPHGFKMKITYTADHSDFEMSEVSDFPDWYFQINYAFLSGDELYISSEFNDKYLYRVRSAVTLNLADLIEPGSLWPMLFPDVENAFTISGHPTHMTIDEWYWYETHWGL